MDNTASEHTSPLKILQISDLHMVEPGKLLRKRIDSRAKAARAIEVAEYMEPDVFVFSGDIAQRKNDIYAEFADTVAALHKRTGKPVITISGNHDVPGVIDARHSSARVADGPHPSNGVYTHRGVRFIGLETHGAKAHCGHLDTPQLDWLETQLTIDDATLSHHDAAAPGGTVIVMHHAPVEASIPVQHGSGLPADEATARFEELMAAHDIRVILAGHYHHQVAGSCGGAPVWVAPAVGYNFNMVVPAKNLHGTDTAWVSLITLNPRNTPEATAPILSAAFSVSITPVSLNEVEPVFVKDLS